MHDANCPFCQIAAGTLPADICYRDDEVVAFHDINPAAPTHILIIPYRHIATANQFGEADAALIGRLPVVAARVAGEQGIATAGYRLVMNCNGHGGQTVFHVHLHLLGGRPMRWPPG